MTFPCIRSNNNSMENKWRQNNEQKILIQKITQNKNVKWIKNRMKLFSPLVVVIVECIKRILLFYCFSISVYLLVYCSMCIPGMRKIPFIHQLFFLSSLSVAVEFTMYSATPFAIFYFLFFIFLLLLCGFCKKKIPEHWV